MVHYKCANYYCYYSLENIYSADTGLYYLSINLTFHCIGLKLFIMTYCT